MRPGDRRKKTIVEAYTYQVQWNVLDIRATVKVTEKALAAVPEFARCRVENALIRRVQKDVESAFLGRQATPQMAFAAGHFAQQKAMEYLRTPFALGEELEPYRHRLGGL